MTKAIGIDHRSEQRTSGASACIACGALGAERMAGVAVDDLIKGYRAPGLATEVAHLMKASSDEVVLWRCQTCDLRWYDPLAAGDERFYEQLQRHVWYYQEDKPEYLHAGAQVPVDAKLLEVGCGSGAFSQHLAAGVSYRGLEFNSEAVRRARARGLDVDAQFVQTVAAAEPGVYDVVASFQVLEHVSDPEGFLRACAEALRPGGRLIIAVPAEDSFLSIGSAVWLNMPPHHLTRWSDAALGNAFKRLGLRVDGCWHEPVASYHADWYASVMAITGWLSLFGSQPRFDGRGRTHGLVRRLRRVPAIDNWLRARGENSFRFAGRGHTVCITGIKEEAQS